MMDPTLEVANAAFSQHHHELEHERAYLGASEIGHDCERKLWYSFRLTPTDPIPAKGRAAIEDGHAGELVIVERLQRVPGLELHAAQGNGDQFKVVACYGHLQGHLDGAVTGLVQAPKTWHVFEAKVCNEKKFNKLKKLAAKDEKSALQEWDSVYYAQAQVYMHLTEMTRHYLVCATPGVRDWFAVRTDYDKNAAEVLIKKAQRIIDADTAPPRVRDDPEYYQCNWCDFKKYCHEKKVPKPNCRNCAHASPVADGEWMCEYKGIENPTLCDDHVYEPSFVPYAAAGEGDPDANTIEYTLPDGRKFKNGTRIQGSSVYTSKELCETDPAIFGDSTVEVLRNQFGGHVTESSFTPSDEVAAIDWTIGDKDIPF